MEAKKKTFREHVKDLSPNRISFLLPNQCIEHGIQVRATATGLVYPHLNLNKVNWFQGWGENKKKHSQQTMGLFFHLLKLNPNLEALRRKEERKKSYTWYTVLFRPFVQVTGDRGSWSERIWYLWRWLLGCEDIIFWPRRKRENDFWATLIWTKKTAKNGKKTKTKTN
jgi:hypothetical protein